MNTQPNPLQLLAALVIDYFRWTQLTPMILLWAMVLGMMFLLFFASHEEATWSMISALLEWIASLPWIGPKFVAFMESQAEDGVIQPDLGGIDFESAVLWVWAIISLGFMAISWVAGLFFGPFKPWTLKRKLGAAALACALIVAAVMALYISDTESFNDSPLKIALSTSGMALVIFLVNAWCLAVSHLLGWVSGMVAEADFSSSTSNDGLL